jgi:glycosyltransferase involved in cell wall biosynthesis
MTVKNKLEIILITYNRCKNLQQTLDEILSERCPIHDLSITVLDNNSTDATAQIIMDQMANHKNVKYRKNPYNLGIGGNIARAMEIATAEYLWIMCDDDIYFWDNWHLLENAIEEDHEVICISNHLLVGNEKVDIPHVIDQFTFVPSIIIKTSLLTDVSMRNTYDAIVTLFPHLVPIITHVNNNNDIFVIPEPIVLPGGKAPDNSFIRGVADNARDLFHKTRSMSFLVGYASIISNLKSIKLKHECFRVAVRKTHFTHPGWIVFYCGVFLHMNGIMNKPLIAELITAAPWTHRKLLQIVQFLNNTWLYDLLVKTPIRSWLQHLYDILCRKH